MDREPTIPPLFSPLAPAIHARHEIVNKQTALWANAFEIGSPELRDRLVDHDIGTFAARILPEGREEVVQLTADFIVWLFGVDDGHCEEGALGTRPHELLGELSRMLRVAENPQVPMLLDDPLAAGLRDLRRRIDVHATPGQATRWVEALRQYFTSVVWEAGHRSRGTVPDLNDYTLMRLYDGATSVILPLLEMAYGYDLHPGERDRTPVRAAAEMAFFVITWDNDLFSHHKESRSGKYFLNVLRVLQDPAHHGLAPQEAITTAVAQRDRVLCLYLRLRRQLAAEGTPQLRQYLHSLDAFVRGAQDWGISSVRYTRPDDPAGLPTTFSDTPTDDRTTPLEIPSVAWWWDLPVPSGTVRTA